MEDKLHAILTSALDGGKFQLHDPAVLPHYSLDRRLSGPKTCLDVIAKRVFYREICYKDVNFTAQARDSV